jgi:hypothetical protein
MTREEKLDQLERVLQARVMHGSESLRAFLRFVSLKTIDHQEEMLKEYVIATEVFGRGSDYDSRLNSVVRVQAGRLRAKLQEYYATEGRDDAVLIDLPKGHYVPVFSYLKRANGETLTAASPAGESHAAPAFEPAPVKLPEPPAEPEPPPRRPRSWPKQAALITLSALVVALLFLTAKYYTDARRLQAQLDTAPTVPADREEAAPLWGDLLNSSEPCLVVFSNTLFEGSAEKGMKLYKSLDSPGSTLGSPALPQSQMPAVRSPDGVIEHYTGIGEVMGVYFLGDFFARVKHPYRVKRSLLLTWDDLKTQNLVVLGSPAENFFLRDLPQQQDFIFRPLKDEKQQDTFGVVNLKPRANEQKTYLAKQEGPSRSQLSEDYAVISSLPGLTAGRRMLILAGITTMGTQAAAEYVTRADYVKDLIAHLNTAPPGEPPRLPSSYQLLVKVKITGGVPVQVSYVAHHVL